MVLENYNTVDDDQALMFGEGRAQCHYPLLWAAYKAEVDVLLPTLYYACSDYLFDSVLERGKLLDTQCLRTLMLGRNMLIRAIDELIVKLIDGFSDGTFECRAKGSCASTARFTGLADFLDCPDLQSIEGSLVDECLSNACPACRKLVGNFINERRREIWDSVPLKFDLPAWPALRDKLTAICQS